jgi:hypothetical protein
VDAGPDAEAEATATGWVTETVTTIATGGSIEAVSAPEQETLEDQPDSLQLVGELPTAGVLSGDEQTQENIEEVQDLFGGFGIDSEDNGGLF